MEKVRIGCGVRRAASSVVVIKPTAQPRATVRAVASPAPKRPAAKPAARPAAGAPAPLAKASGDDSMWQEF